MRKAERRAMLGEPHVAERRRENEAYRNGLPQNPEGLEAPIFPGLPGLFGIKPSQISPC
jgi:hypothetical protein